MKKWHKNNKQHLIKVKNFFSTFFGDKIELMHENQAISTKCDLFSPVWSQCSDLISHIGLIRIQTPPPAKTTCSKKSSTSRRGLTSTLNPFLHLSSPSADASIPSSWDILLPSSPPAGAERARDCAPWWRVSPSPWRINNMASLARHGGARLMPLSCYFRRTESGI